MGTRQARDGIIYILRCRYTTIWICQNLYNSAQNGEFYRVYIISYYKNEGETGGMDVVIPGIKIYNVHRKWK